MNLQNKFNAPVRALLKRWWFLVLFPLFQLIPPWASEGYELRHWGQLNAFILTHPIKIIASGYFPIFKIIPLLLLAAILLTGKRAGKIFSLYAAGIILFCAVLQNISISREYGIAVCLSNMVTFAVLAAFWLGEGLLLKNRLTFRQIPFWKYWPFLPALLAFWEPVNSQTLLPDFSPILLLTSGAGLSFCMITPLLLAVLLVHFPQVNLNTLAVTSLVGLGMGLGNFYLEFILIPSYWWIGCLHIPLVFLSGYGLWLVMHEEWVGVTHG
jgi:hypothetical protein